MSRPVDQNSREKSEFYPQKSVKPVYSCIFGSFVDQNSREFVKTSTPDFRENSKFWQKFPGKNLNFGSKIPGNPYIPAFLGVLSTKIPGNSWKCWPPIFVKIRNFDRNFPGKIWISAREFRETRIFLHFGDLCWYKFPGIFVEVSPIFEKFCKSFPGKNLIFTSRNTGNPWITQFLEILST